MRIKLRIGKWNFGLDSFRYWEATAFRNGRLKKVNVGAVCHVPLEAAIHFAFTLLESDL